MGKTARFFRFPLLPAACAICLGCSTLTLEEALLGGAVSRGAGSAAPSHAEPAGAAAARSAVAASGPLTEVQGKLVEGAYAVLGRDRLVVRGRRFRLDCTGVVLAVYWYAGIDLSREMNRYSGNGVARLYRALGARELLYDTDRPAPGDLIFWDNTYDRNRDGRWNDPLTHAAVVVHSDPDGMVEYVHANYRRGIVIERMNLLEPDTWRRRVGGRLQVINSPMRMRERGRPHPPQWLASHLYRSFGMAWRLDS